MESEAGVAETPWCLLLNGLSLFPAEGEASAAAGIYAGCSVIHVMFALQGVNILLFVVSSDLKDISLLFMDAHCTKIKHVLTAGET